MRRRLRTLMLILGTSTLLMACQAKTVETEVTNLEDPVSEGISHEAEQAPALSLKDINGNTIDLASYKGQYVYINFWNTECKFCINELDELKVFSEAHANELKVLTVHVGDDSNLKKVVEANDFNLPVMLDLDGSAAESFMVQAYPSTYLIDKEGRINGFIPEELTAEALEGSFEFLKQHESEQK